MIPPLHRSGPKRWAHERGHQVRFAVRGDADDANDRKDSGNDSVVMVVDEEELRGGRRSGGTESRGEPEADAARGGTQEGRVEGQQSRGNLISACGGF